MCTDAAGRGKQPRTWKNEKLAWVDEEAASVMAFEAPDALLV